MAEIEFIMEDADAMADEALGLDGDAEWERKKKEQRCVIIDIDGTLANVDSGTAKTKSGEFDWKLFFKLIPWYPPNEWCVRLTQAYYNMGFVVYIVSGRPSEYKDKTEKWLAKHGVPYDFLYMRPLEDKRPDDVVKQEILDNLLPKKELIEFVVDDRQSVVDMWRKNGLTVLQCNPHDFI